MKWPVLMALGVLACIATAGPMAARAADDVVCPTREKPVKPPDCSKCSDLPMLYRELLEQEFLRNLFESWIKQDYYPRSTDEIKASAERQLSNAMRQKTKLYGVLAPQGGGTGGAAAPAYATDLSTRECKLLEYVTCTKDSGTKKESKVQVPFPTTEADVRARHCKPIADYLIKHEGHHQDQCAKNWKQSKSDAFITPEYVVKDDRDAYQAGIGLLRDSIAKLATECNWTGSTNAKRPDGTMTVPTPQQIQELKDNTRTKGLRLKRRSQ
jgi:hypothetical protein